MPYQGRSSGTLLPEALNAARGLAPRGCNTGRQAAAVHPRIDGDHRADAPFLQRALVHGEPASVAFRRQSDLRHPVAQPAAKLQAGAGLAVTSIVPCAQLGPWGEGRAGREEELVAQLGGEAEPPHVESRHLERRAVRGKLGQRAFTPQAERRRPAGEEPGR